MDGAPAAFNSVPMERQDDDTDVTMDSISNHDRTDPGKLEALFYHQLIILFYFQYRDEFDKWVGFHT